MRLQPVQQTENMSSELFIERIMYENLGHILFGMGYGNMLLI